MRRLMFILAIAACERSTAVELELLVGERTRSILLISDDGDELRAFGDDIPAGGALRFEVLERYVGAYPLELTAFSYEHPLASFGFEAGAIAMAEDGVPVPSTSDRRRAVLRGAELEEWRSIDAAALGDRVAGVRLAGARIDAQCLDEGRCFDLDADNPEACIDCPDPADPAAPIPPAPPDLGSCVGWVLADALGTAVCAPWDGEAPPCAAFEIALPGSAACVRVGSACPVGEYSEQIPAGPVRTVGPSGDYATIAAAVAGAPAGTTIALAKGTFDEIAVIPPGVLLLGACAASTSILGVVAGDGSSVADLTIAADDVAVRAEAGAAVRMDGVAIASRNTSVLVEAGADVEIANGWITAQSIVSDGRLSLIGARVEARIETSDELAMREVYLTGNLKGLEGGTIAMERSVIAGGEIRLEGADAILDQIAIDRSSAAPGITVRLGSAATIRRAWIRSADEANILVRGIGTRMALEDSILSDPQGDGVRILATATATIARTIIERSSGAGVFLDEAGSNAALRDVVIRDVGSDARGFSGNGVHMEADTSLDLRRAHLERIAGKALDVDGATATIEDVSIDSTGSGDCHQCAGVCAFGVARLAGERLWIRNTAGRGIGSKGAGCNVEASDVRIERAVRSADCVLENPNSSPRLGQGAVAAESGSLALSRFAISECSGAGLALEEFDVESFDTAIVASDGAVIGNASGVHLQVPEYPLSRVANRVLYRDNRVNVVR